MNISNLNYDLKLQLADYLYNNYPRVLDALIKIDENLYPAILYTLRKYRNTDLEFQIMDKRDVLFNDIDYSFLAKNGYYDIIKKHINMGNISYQIAQSILGEAISHNWPKIVKLILTSYKNSAGEFVKLNTIRIISNFIRTGRNIPSNYIMKLLIKYGADHDYNELIRTAMSYNKRNKYNSVIKYLIHHTINKDYQKYLKDAIQSEGNIEIVKYLIDALGPLDLNSLIAEESRIPDDNDANISPFTNLREYIQYLINNDNSNRNYDKSITRAAGHGNYDIIQLLLQYNQGPANYNEVINNLARYNNLELVQRLITQNKGEHDYFQGLYNALDAGNYNMLKLLFDNKSVIITPYTNRAYNGIIDKAISEGYLNIAKYLLEHSQQKPRDYTATINKLVKHGNLPMIKLLTQYNQNKNYQQAIIESQKRGYNEIVEFLTNLN